MKDIFSRIGVVRTYAEGKVIKVIWDDLNDREAIYRSAEAQLEAMNKENVAVVITDVSHAKGTTPVDVQLWFTEVLFPKYKACKTFKGLINILPKDLGMKVANQWASLQGKNPGFITYDTTSMHDAEHLANSIID